MKSEDLDEIRRLLRNVRNLIRAALADLDRIAESLCEEIERRDCEDGDG